MSKQQELLIQKIKMATYEDALKLLNEYDKQISYLAYRHGYDVGYDKGYDRCHDVFDSEIRGN